jgi:SNF2 family DNA or RNA helicase
MELFDYQRKAIFKMCEFVEKRSRVRLDARDLNTNEIIYTKEYSLNLGTLSLPMGSGKTFICLEYLKQELSRDSTLPCLIFVPYSLVAQWKDEIYKYFDREYIDTNIYVIHSISKCGGKLNFSTELGKLIDKYKIIVMNMKILKMYSRVCEILNRYEYNKIIVDEEICHIIESFKYDFFVVCIGYKNM